MLFFKHNSWRVLTIFIMFSFFFTRERNKDSGGRWSYSVVCPSAEEVSYLMSPILPNYRLCFSFFFFFFFSPGFGRSYSRATGSESLWIKQVIWSCLEEIQHICLCLVFDTCVDIQGFSSCYCWMISFQQKPGLPFLICMCWRDYNFISEGHFVTVSLCQQQNVLLQTTPYVHLERAHLASDSPLISVKEGNADVPQVKCSRCAQFLSPGALFPREINCC